MIPQNWKLKSTNSPNFLSFFNLNWCSFWMISQHPKFGGHFHPISDEFSVKLTNWTEQKDRELNWTEIGPIWPIFHPNFGENFHKMEWNWIKVKSDDVSGPIWFELKGNSTWSWTIWRPKTSKRGNPRSRLCKFMQMRAENRANFEWKFPRFIFGRHLHQLMDWIWSSISVPSVETKKNLDVDRTAMAAAILSASTFGSNRTAPTKRSTATKKI